MQQFDEVTTHPAFVAGAGAFVSLILARKMTAIQAVLAWVAGWCCAYYLAPFVITYFGLTTEAQKIGSGFLIGAFGLQITAMIYDVIGVIRENPRATLTAVVDILLKRKGG